MTERKLRFQSHLCNGPVKVNPLPTPTPRQPGKGEDLNKRTRKSVFNVPAPGKYIFFNVLAWLPACQWRYALRFQFFFVKFHPLEGPYSFRRTQRVAHKHNFQIRLWQVVQCYKRRYIVLISLLWCLPGCRLYISKFNFWEDFINQVIWIASDTQVGSKISDAFFKGFLLRVGWLLSPK